MLSLNTSLYFQLASIECSYCFQCVFKYVICFCAWNIARLSDFIIRVLNRYKNELRKEDKVNLNTLVAEQRHKLVRQLVLLKLCALLYCIRAMELMASFLLKCRLHLKFLGSWTIAAIVVKRGMILCWSIS